MNFALILPAAGSGSRLARNKPKALIEIAGKPLFVHAALPFLKADGFVCGVIACPSDRTNQFQAIGTRFFGDKKISYVAGGATRQDSVGNALKAIPEGVDAVLIHDAARPLVCEDLIRRVLAALQGECAAAVPGIPVTDTIKQAEGTPLVVRATIPREGLFAIQTPQALVTETARRAHEIASRDAYQATDDAALVEHYGLGPVRLVAGDSENFKLTTADDLARAETLLSSRP